MPLAELPRFLDPMTREGLVRGLKALGFRHIALDLEGLRSGSLNPPDLAGGGGAKAPATPVKDS